MSSTIFTSLLTMETDPEKMTEQVGFKVSPASFKQLQAAAHDERRKRNEFARLLFEWALDKYKEAGSYDALTGRARAAVPPYHSVIGDAGVIKEELDKREKIGIDIHGPTTGKRKPNRSKAS